MKVNTEYNFILGQSKIIYKLSVVTHGVRQRQSSLTINLSTTLVPQDRAALQIHSERENIFFS